MEEGKWFLEDSKSHIELDFSGLEKSSLHSGFFTEGSIVIVEGEVMNDRDAFLVKSMQFGPAEPQETTLRAFPSIDFFGAQLDHRLQERLEKYEAHFQESDTGNFLVVSDIWMDDAKIFEKLKFVLSGANSAPPFALILMGNFTSPANASSLCTYIECFERLADSLLLHPQLLQNTRIVFIPGPTDLTPSRDVFPSPSLTKPIRDAFEKRIKRGVAALQHASSSNAIKKEWPRITFASNPVRIRFCTKQLVFFREDVTHKLRRHCFLKPSTNDGEALSDHLVRTICDQSHLCPLPINVKPVFWNYDHAMRLYPLPNFITLSDQSSRFVIEYEGSKTLSPGSFAIDSTFASISPLSGQVNEYKA
jgi:DNA polymerase epsilon subunit 2